MLDPLALVKGLLHLLSGQHRDATPHDLLRGERTTKDGKKTVYERKAGTSVWLEADSDVVKNIGKTTFVVVSVTPK